MICAKETGKRHGGWRRHERGRGRAARRKRRRRTSWTDRQIAWLLVLPAALLILALSIYPLLYSVWVAFVNYDFQIPGHAFVGLQNFREIVE